MATTYVPGTGPAPDHVFTADPVDKEEYDRRWEEIWSVGLQPGQRWDRAKASPCLVDAVSSGEVSVQDKRVIVPGCGRGYDVVAFAKLGAKHVTGVELAPTAVEAASEYVRSEGVDTSQATVTQGDFFTFADPQGPFDVGFDYTFGCAMHPTMRQQWAQGWAQQIAPGGVLLTLIFPIDPNMDPNIGPPFPITYELFKSLLEPAGFTCVTVRDVPAHLSHEGRAGREKWAVWQRK